MSTIYNQSTHPDFRDGKLLVGEARKHTNIARPADLRVGMALARVVHGQLGEVLERTSGVEVQGAQLVRMASVAVRVGKWEGRVSYKKERSRKRSRCRVH